MLGHPIWNISRKFPAILLKRRRALSRAIAVKAGAGWINRFHGLFILFLPNVTATVSIGSFLQGRYLHLAAVLVVGWTSDGPC
jgi:hypothetical protein